MTALLCHPQPLFGLFVQFFPQRFHPIGITQGIGTRFILPVRALHVVRNVHKFIGNILVMLPRSTIPGLYSFILQGFQKIILRSCVLHGNSNPLAQIVLPDIRRRAAVLCGILVFFL